MDGLTILLVILAVVYGLGVAFGVRSLPEAWRQPVVIGGALVLGMLGLAIGLTGD